MIKKKKLLEELVSMEDRRSGGPFFSLSKDSRKSSRKLLVKYFRLLRCSPFQGRLFPSPIIKWLPSWCLINGVSFLPSSLVSTCSQNTDFLKRHFAFHDNSAPIRSIVVLVGERKMYVAAIIVRNLATKRVFPDEMVKVDLTRICLKLVPICRCWWEEDPCLVSDLQFFFSCLSA